LQETPVNVKEESECLAEADKMETEEEETSEESLSLRAEINGADKEIKENVGGDKDTAVETKNESKSYVSTEETTLKQCLQEGTVARDSDLPLSGQDRDGLCDKLPVSGRRSSTNMNEVKCPEEDISIQNYVCSQTAGIVPSVKKAVMCDEEGMVCQNVTENFVKVTNGIEKRKRGRPRKPRVGENLKTDKGENNGTCGMSQFNKIDLNNEVENLAHSFSSKEIFNRKQYKPARRHKEKTVNGLAGTERKRRAQASQILSDVLHKPGEMDFEEQCREGLGQQNTKEENESRHTVKGSRPSEGKADSSIEVQTLCNETKSTSSNMVAANGIEALNVLIPPVES
jgi:hypothetical protein